MLYILTGQIQTGKTRWLQSFIEKKESAGASIYGVVAPGVWLDHGEDADPRFEKLGIDNELLPDHRVVHFARRRDLTLDGDVFAQGQQAAKEKLGWAISDQAIAEVDAYFAELLEQCATCEGECAVAASLSPVEVRGAAGDFSSDQQTCAGLSPVDAQANAPASSDTWLIVDELGRLELLRDGGLVHAVRLLEKGPTPLASNALVVVREDLVPYAIEKLKEAWPDRRVIQPGSLV